MSQTVIELSVPLKDGGNEITALKLRRPTVRDLLVMDGVQGDLHKTVRMIAQLADLPPDVIEQMDVKDFEKASTAVADFLG
ncbi:phage tail assembly protein [Sulfurivirga sp.]|uniref:phage tail assembly protein n=1 Tax=Sulfurivirga sp. TaxID=2614236 RepID=UPI0025D0F04E|nr:phage tail assembly protein [Sulfurivirga sp.]